jgi:hypothetical protein
MTADGSPSPGGEARGEGERLFQLHSLGSLEIKTFARSFACHTPPSGCLDDTCE